MRPSPAVLVLVWGATFCFGIMRVLSLNLSLRSTPHRMPQVSMPAGVSSDGTRRNELRFGSGRFFFFAKKYWRSLSWGKNLNDCSKSSFRRLDKCVGCWLAQEGRTRVGQSWIQGSDQEVCWTLAGVVLDSAEEL